MTSATQIRSRQVLVGDGWRPADLTLSDGMIAGIAPIGSAQDPMDLGDLAVVPGMIDVQCNGGFGHDFTLEPETIWDVGAHLPETGVTAFMPTLVTSPAGSASRLIDVLDRRPPDYVGAEPLGIHIEGPMLSRQRRGAHNPDLLKERVDVSEWKPPAVRIVTLAPEVAGLDLVRELVAQGVVVAIGHSNATFEQATAAIAAGASHTTHLFNAMPPFNHRDPGVVGAVFANTSVAASVIADGVHVHPAALQVAMNLLGPTRFVTITDAIAAAGMPPGEYRVGSMALHSDGTRATLADGTLAGSVLTMDTAVRNLINMAGVPLADAVRSATDAPALMLGEDNRGRIDVGRRADLTVMDPDLAVVATIIDGNVTFDGLP